MNILDMRKRLKKMGEQLEALEQRREEEDEPNASEVSSEDGQEEELLEGKNCFFSFSEGIEGLFLVFLHFSNLSAWSTTQEG